MAGHSRKKIKKSSVGTPFGGSSPKTQTKSFLKHKLSQLRKGIKRGSSQGVLHVDADHILGVVRGIKTAKRRKSRSGGR